MADDGKSWQIDEKETFFLFFFNTQVLSAKDVSILSDGTVACDPALRPVVIDVTGTTFSSLGYNGTAPYAPDLLCEYQFQAGSNVSTLWLRLTAGQHSGSKLDHQCAGCL
jgi:hypothetical protein